MPDVSLNYLRSEAKANGITPLMVIPPFSLGPMHFLVNRNIYTSLSAFTFFLSCMYGPSEYSRQMCQKDKKSRKKGPQG